MRSKLVQVSSAELSIYNYWIFFLLVYIMLLTAFIALYILTSIAAWITNLFRRPSEHNHQVSSAELNITIVGFFFAVYHVT